MLFYCENENWIRTRIEMNLRTKITLFWTQCRLHFLPSLRRNKWRHVKMPLLQRDMPDFLPPTLWPPNSPYLNPVDYWVGSATGLCVLHAGEQSCTSVTETVNGMGKPDHLIVVAAVNQWRGSPYLSVCLCYGIWLALDTLSTFCDGFVA